MSPLPRFVAVLAIAALGLGACSSGGKKAAGTPEDPLQVEASFYPLQWLAEQVGGDRVAVHGLTKPGAEPHDLELSPRDVGAVQDADLVAYLSGFQPSVDEAVADASGTVYDAHLLADLDPNESPLMVGRTADEGEERAFDPHFWLDPSRMAKAASALADALAERDPDHAADYRANATALRARLGALDRELRVGLQDCQDRYLVTGHAAFGYLAHRYGLEQVGITGLSPEAEPSPKDLAQVADFVHDHDVRTIYSETLVSPAVARALADETGARARVLDPIEGLDDRSAGDDYLSVMRSNLSTLRTGQGCR